MNPTGSMVEWKGVRLTGAALRVVTQSNTEIAGLPVPPTMADHVILEGEGADTWVILVWRVTEALYAKAILFKGVEDVPLESTRVARVSIAGGVSKIDLQMVTEGAKSQLRQEFQIGR